MPQTNATIIFFHRESLKIGERLKSLGINQSRLRQYNEKRRQNVIIKEWWKNSHINRFSLFSMRKYSISLQEYTSYLPDGMIGYCCKNQTSFKIKNLVLCSCKIFNSMRKNFKGRLRSLLLLELNISRKYSNYIYLTA